MIPGLAKGSESLRTKGRATWILLATSLALLVLLVAAYANLSMRQARLQGGIKEDAVWAVYQMGRQVRGLRDTMATVDRYGHRSAAEYEALAQQYDILWSRMSTVVHAKYGPEFSSDPEVTEATVRMRDLVTGMEREFTRIADPAFRAQAIATIRRSLDELARACEELLVRTNAIVSAARADARSEILHLQNVTAWIVLALSISVVLLIVGLVRRLRATRAAGEQMRLIADRLKAALTAADAGNRAKSEFMAVVGHEIRTPLNAVLGMAELLSFSDLRADDADAVRAIRVSGALLLETINEILDFAKIEHGDEGPESIAFSPSEVVRQAVAIVEGRARERGNAIEVSLPETTEAFLGDPTRLRRVLINLLSNAVKFTEAGRVRVEVETVGDEEAPRLRFAVTDTGIGIPKEARHLLFQAFTQVDGTIGRRFGGTGLGLAICKRLVEALGGEIDVESRPGVGSRFWFEVPSPRAELSDAASPTASVPTTSVKDTGEIRCLDVLVVEDNAFNRTVVGRFLGRLGHTVTFAHDGEEAVLACLGRAFDLILMDMQMPVLDGIEAARRIRASGGPNTATPIVALTANASEADRKRCAEVGMDGFEAKPVSLAALRSLVANWGARNGAVPPSVAPVVGKTAPTASTPSFEAASAPQVDEARVTELTAVIGADGLTELRDAFLEDALTLLHDLGEAMRRDDAEARDRVLHTIKGAASNVGYAGLARLAEDLRRTPPHPDCHHNLAAEIGRLNAGLSRAGSLA